MGILSEDMQRLVHEQRLAFVASVGADGTPSLSPKATTLVYDDDHLAYLDIASPGTRANIAAEFSAYYAKLAAERRAASK